MAEPLQEERLQTGNDERLGSVRSEKDRSDLRARLVDAVAREVNEAAEIVAVDPAIRAILSLRELFVQGDPETALHLLRVAAMRLQLPYTSQQSDDLRDFMGGVENLKELINVRAELEQLPINVGDHEFTDDWFEAYVDLFAATGKEPWPQNV